MQYDEKWIAEKIGASNQVNLESLIIAGLSELWCIDASTPSTGWMKRYTCYSKCSLSRGEEWYDDREH